MDGRVDAGTLAGISLYAHVQRRPELPTFESGSTEDARERSNDLTVVSIGIVAAIVVIAAGLLIWVLRAQKPKPKSLPPLIIPLARNATPGPPILDRERFAAAAPVSAPPPLQPRETATHQPEPRAPEPTAPAAEEPQNGAETVRFYRPADNAVQLLPGRLEVLAGTTPLREIRFVRIPGEPPHLILGRDPGPSPQQVGLGSATVSRRHARFDYTGRGWEVRNLSRTNPLIVNDEELSDTDAARPLADGDRLELGEVVLRFHAH